MIRNIATASVLVAAALAATAGPAFASLPYPVLPSAFSHAAIQAASVHTPFAVVDNGGALLTHQPLHVGQVVYSGGLAYTVHRVETFGGVYEFSATPFLPASDQGRTLTFVT